MRCGISIKPSTPLSTDFLNLLKLVDLCLIMTVEPGFGGQKFDEKQLDKVRKVRELFPDLDIQVDGGVKRVNVEDCAKAGANVFVSGTGIFGMSDEKGEIEYFRQISTKHL
jgi:ribulose-phosphate 3-epimerase